MRGGIEGMKHNISRVFLLIIVLVQGTFSFANFEKPAHSGEPAGNHAVQEDFNAGKMIMEHIMDAHDWHLWDWNGHPVSVSLPIIIYDEARGFSFFGSGNFHHGETPYDGYALVHEKIIAVNADGSINEEKTAKVWDFSITKNAVALLFSCVLLLIIFLTVAKRYRTNPDEAPKGLQALLEPVILFVRDDVAKLSIKHNHERYMPYLLTIFFFIWINNLLGLIPIIPGGANVTGNVAVPIVMAAFTFFIMMAVSNKHYWQHVLWMPGVPIAIKPLMMAIELIGVFIKPIVLVVRLFANITAGHIVILVFISLIFIFGDNGNSTAGGFIASVPAIAFAIFLNMLEILVGAIQAYVFTLLSAIYFGMATEKAH